MTRSLALAAAVTLLSGCSDSADGNPPRLWLALLGGETMVQLVPNEPDPY